MQSQETFDNTEFQVYASKNEKEDGTQPLYNQGLFPYTLVYQKTSDPFMNDREFYGRRISSKTGQTNYLHAQDKQFHTFLAIGISESNQIEIKAKFIFPRLLNKTQFIFLSDDFSRLLEINNLEASIYEL